MELPVFSNQRQVRQVCCQMIQQMNKKLRRKLLKLMILRAFVSLRQPHI